MAYLTRTHPKRQEPAPKINLAARKSHNHSFKPIKRRLVQILCGFCVGFVISCVVLQKNATFVRKCGGRLALAWYYDESEDTYDDSGMVVEPAKLAPVSATASDRMVRGANKSLLFVGVMTAQKYLSTRAAAVYDTWGKEIAGNVAFFSSATSTKPPNWPDLPLIPLQGVDDSYPPQRKSFTMLQYMWEKFGDKYEWFLRADDDVYIRADKIEKFLRSINSEKAYFIGQAGRGKQEEFGTLSLEYDQNFCMGGPGIILSRETLRRMAPHLQYCLKNLYTAHEDVEVGRCVQKFAGISCTWSYEMQSIFYHNSSGNLAFTDSLKTKEVHRAITLHPIKQHKHLYRVHNHMQGLKVHELQQRRIGLYRDLLQMTDFLKNRPEYSAVKSILSFDNADELINEANLFGKQPNLLKYHARTEEDVFTWDFISRALFSDTNLNPRRKMETHLLEGLDDVVREVMDYINLFSLERGRIIEFQQILYGYRQLNPLYGPNYILDVLLTFKKYRGKKMTVPVRRHAYLQQQFVALEIKEVPIDGCEEEFQHSQPFIDAIENVQPYSNRLPPQFNLNSSSPNRPVEKLARKLINFVLPLAGKHDAFVRFMRTYEDVCLKSNENTALIVVLFIDKNEDEFSKASQIVADLRIRYQFQHPRAIQIVPIRETFARAKALQYGMARVEPNDLVFFIDVDMAWDGNTLRRIRLNTVLGRSIYFPIVFSEFDPTVIYNSKLSPNHFMISDESGYWRNFGFGIVSAYKADIAKVGGFDTSIVGWGREDVDLFDKFISSSNITIIRSVDPSLVHIFHIVDCDPTLDTARYTMCCNTRRETYGSVNRLASLLYTINSALFSSVTPKDRI